MRVLDICFAITVAVMWGGNFVAGKYGVAYFPPIFITGLRFVLVAAMLLPFVPRPSVRQMRIIFPIAVMSTLHFSLLFAALAEGMDIASCAVIGQLGVPFACILGAIFLKDRVGIWRISGIAIAFIGVAIVAGTPNILDNMTAFYIMLGGTFSWGSVNVLVKRAHDIPSMTLLAWVSLFTIPMLFGLSYVVEGNNLPLLESPPLSAVTALFYTAIGSTVVAYGLWYKLLSQYDVSQVTPFSLLAPVFGIAFGQMFFTEELTLQIIIGGLLTIAGVALIVLRRPKTLPLGEAT
jgi:O-acetylserine/cysteine efflux transporter